MLIKQEDITPADEEAGKGYVVLRDDSLEYRLGCFDL